MDFHPFRGPRGKICDFWRRVAAARVVRVRVHAVHYRVASRQNRWQPRRALTTGYGRGASSSPSGAARDVRQRRRALAAAHGRRHPPAARRRRRVSRACRGEQGAGPMRRQRLRRALPLPRGRELCPVVRKTPPLLFFSPIFRVV